MTPPSLVPLFSPEIRRSREEGVYLRPSHPPYTMLTIFMNLLIIQTLWAWAHPAQRVTCGEALLQAQEASPNQIQYLHRMIWVRDKNTTGKRRWHNFHCDNNVIFM